MKIFLPDSKGVKTAYQLSGKYTPAKSLPPNPARIVYSAAHVTADPFSPTAPSGAAAIDWQATMAFRHHLAGLGLGIAEAMDTAQRGMGLDWPNAWN